ncbi:hypothetical protein Zmor_027798 [Zophobas morio]|uniref:Uncharacterized protein n=1 Tax=Zophobas morio TaxID=2755281 RepID=A0AA38M2U0_9CUCU|nr:hypothetical protein Zmor_027798 [Zophobas morio]
MGRFLGVRYQRGSNKAQLSVLDPFRWGEGSLACIKTLRSAQKPSLAPSPSTGVPFQGRSRALCLCLLLQKCETPLRSGGQAFYVTYWC